MYTKARLIDAINAIAPHLVNAQCAFPVAVREAGVVAFVHQIEDADARVIREALNDLWNHGQFEYTDEPAYLQSVPEGVWVPACGGTERVFTSRSGKRLLYCYNRTLGKHAYLDVDRDIILTDKEAADALETGA